MQTMYDGVRPDHRSAPNNCHWHGFNGSYQPMRKQVRCIDLFAGARRRKLHRYHMQWLTRIAYSHVMACHHQGAIILGTGGDNSNGAFGMCPPPPHLSSTLLTQCIDKVISTRALLRPA